MDIDEYLQNNPDETNNSSVGKNKKSQLEKRWKQKKEEEFDFCLPSLERVNKPTLNNSDYLKLYYSKQERGSDSESPKNLVYNLTYKSDAQKRMKRSIRAKNKNSRFGIIKSFNGSDVGQLPEIN